MADGRGECGGMRGTPKARVGGQRGRGRPNQCTRDKTPTRELGAGSEGMENEWMGVRRFALQLQRRGSDE